MDQDVPHPAADLAHKSIPILRYSQLLFRSHSAAHSPMFYGKTGYNRFDAPDKSYGVLYAGRDAGCAFIETFANSAGTRVVTTAALRQRALSELEPRRPLRLVDLTQPGALLKLGADARLFSASHRIAQVWSKSLYDHRSKADGLLYPSRLDPTCPSIALFEGRGPELIEISRQNWYAPGPLRPTLAAILNRYDLELIVA